MSFGGLVTIRVAAELRHRISGLVLISSLMLARTGVAQRFEVFSGREINAAARREFKRGSTVVEGKVNLLLRSFLRASFGARHAAV